jgi:uncharacterized repeat protein (TIGR03803 family)
MRSVRFYIRVTTTLLVLFCATAIGVSAQQLEETLIFNFAGLASRSGDGPFSNLVFDQQGNLYGTTYRGGTGNCIDHNKNIVGCGTVFELTQVSGVWTVTRQYNFRGGQDGQKPYGPVTLDTAGNVYGTTETGGGSGACYDEGILVGCGTIFRLSPNASGGWKKTLIHALSGGASDGAFPLGGLTFDHAGNLFGTTAAAGSFQEGTVFAIRRANGAWSFSTIYNFGSNANDGDYPTVAVIVDKQGNLYGNTTYGGDPACDCGIVFKLTHTASGWNEAILYRFELVTDGAHPYAPLVLDENTGKLLGTTSDGGNGKCFPNAGCGTIFALSRSSGGDWKETKLHQFTGGSSDGSSANGLVLDSSGNIYGTTFGGGASDSGTVFKLSRADRTWTILHSFSGGATDGALPSAAVTLDSLGNLYGTTAQGGTYGLGTVFEVIQ